MRRAARTDANHAAIRAALGRKPSKYRNVKTTVDGIKFDSKREASRWINLQVLLRLGWVRQLRRQVPFVCAVNGAKVCKYVADFVYEEALTDNGRKITGWREVVEDAKSPHLAKHDRAYRLKKKLVAACHGITIREV